MARDTTPFVALKNALIESDAGGSDVTAKCADGQLLPGPRRLSALLPDVKNAD